MNTFVSWKDIRAEHVDLELEDIPAALNYAAEALADRRSRRSS